jgi:hypothetical protein
VVWTLHDQFAFTGGCHYSSGCHGFETDCSSCPQLVPRSTELARVMLSEKRRTYGRRPLTVIAPSRWMANWARASAVLGDKRIEILPNAVETHVFRPGHKQQARKALGFPEEGFLLLFGAEYGGTASAAVRNVQKKSAAMPLWFENVSRLPTALDLVAFLAPNVVTVSTAKAARERTGQAEQFVSIFLFDRNTVFGIISRTSRLDRNRSDHLQCALKTRCAFCGVGT